jgi:hypothetical protein
MLLSSTVKPVILVYEFFRIFVLCATRVGRSVVVLPASWYGAVPLLVLPFVLQVLYQLERDHAAVYGRLYLLAKGLSALGCFIYILRTLGAAFSDTNGIDYYALSSSVSFDLFVFFFLIDVILLLMTIFKKRKTEGKKLKGGANDASFD